MVSFDYMYDNYFSQVCAIVAAITKDGTLQGES